MGEVTIDPTIKIRPSAELKTFLSEISATDDLFEGLKDVPQHLFALKSDSMLTVEDFHWLHSFMRLKKEELAFMKKGFRFHELLETCDVVLPEPKFPPRNPELEARVQKLRREQENREYQRMTKNVGGLPQQNDSNTDESISKQSKKTSKLKRFIHCAKRKGSSFLS